ncbi:hypothetical protein MG5_04975 [Candida albicans P57072]|uniref:Uncharacterized protein n=4 Tax=Candida albicans TaxID=5476 RepID=A0A1D8PQL7_CANAL|nr:uncharacterized protein CAALFM_C700420CA [Candida albicans SC5314]EEQ46854.1 conserved hypothetical protein [Candida albicans WO-1]KGQ83516.1 hypothetical protein MEO_04923 [Candida albicans P94015]KGQ85345.1 hypothetical protein MEU_04994 [Candida albicans P37005]KGR03257.1 hypothetical protein MG5_04975 [Candida albicans P57072]KGR05466.1 hypothetical protein MG3_05035 [Candida albicans P78048]KGR09715.1 hypothetical protein MG9_05002 [Candida albicans P37037]KGT65294.1 hypothetical pro|eukprot:XP_720369.1 hypothetical protein CAALFM_C700420CA [Candida albicans SC5314]
MDNLQQQEQNTIAYSYFVDESGKSRVKSQHVLLVIIILVCLLVFHFRHKIIELHDRYRTRSRIDSGYYSNLQSFEDDVASGLSSSNFDLESNNIATNDNRAGLSESAKLQIKKIMEEKGVSFDDARLEYTRNELSKNNIDENGVPRDPKLVMF